VKRERQRLNKENRVTKHATGSFDVKVNPQPAYDTTPGSPLVRFSLDKTFSGDLTATSIGEMLAAGTAGPGSGVYVAIERVTGTLAGRSGTFVLHHTGIMNRGVSSLSVRVAPDSATDQLVGLTGTMEIIIADGKHSYDFDYDLSDPA
jgi:hypothetical protein